jgi:hypothetical protein
MDRAYFGDPSGKEKEGARVWVRSASARVGAVPVTYRQYRNGLVGHCGPMGSDIASVLLVTTFIVQGS